MPTGTTISFIISGKERQFSRALWEKLDGPKPEERFSCDGCSSSPDDWHSFTAKKKIPIVMACVTHDFHYRQKPLGEGYRARRKADAILRQNLRKVMMYYGASMKEAEHVAWLYWGRVRIWGRHAWDGNPSFFARIAEVWGSGE
jgi:hypothetical protein